MALQPFTIPAGTTPGGKPMFKPLVLGGSPVFVDQSTGEISWVAGMQIDVDGSGPSHGDPYYQSDTTLHLNGKPLNADEDCYIVAPPQIVQYAERNLGIPRAIVMGCQGQVFNRVNKKIKAVVVGDRGPKTKIGEASRATALAVGVNGDPVRGGESAHIIEYKIKPNVAAVVDDKTYTLQPS